MKRDQDEKCRTQLVEEDVLVDVKVVFIRKFREIQLGCRLGAKRLWRN